MNKYSVSGSVGKFRALAGLVFPALLGVACAQLPGEKLLSENLPVRQTQNGKAMAHLAKGSFDVQLSPQPVAPNEAKLPGRMLIEKQFRGDLAARSRGQMLTAMTEIKGSAGYVAIEQVTGILGDRAGSFVLQHSGTMTRGEPALQVTVVPDSGIGQLRGLRGSMKIDIVDGKHFYQFDYSFVDLPEN